MRDRDHRFMAQAVAAARRGLGATYPNPCVGAVVVRRGRVVARGRSRPTGGAHAEVVALARAGRSAQGATLYVTLEPCRHQGRTPPCTRAIAVAGVARVVIGVLDPAAHVAGKGVAALRRAGVSVAVGVAGPDCAALHEHYLHHVRTGRPFVTLKAATSLDGRIACETGDSRWITGERARKHGHRQRATHHAIAVGAATVLADDPRLNVRWGGGVDPTPIVWDPSLRLGRPGVPELTLLRGETIVLHTARAPTAARRRLRARGVELLEVGASSDGRVDVDAALLALGARSFRSLLVEGGGRLLGAFLREAAWQRWLLYQAPKVLGEGVAVVGGVAWKTVGASPRMRVESRRALGADQLIVVRPVDGA